LLRPWSASIQVSPIGPSISEQSFDIPKLVSFWSSSPLASSLIREIHHQIRLISCNPTMFALGNSRQALFLLLRGLRGRAI
jgi:hypothetical protein